jgi:hypothetical protein
MRVSVLICAVVVLSCGNMPSGADGGTGGSSAGTGGSSAGAGGSSAGTGGSSAGAGGSSAGAGGSSAGTGGSTGNGKNGFISLSQTSIATFVSSSALAGFSTSTGQTPGGAANCTSRTVGPCTSSRCTFNLDAGMVDAGTVTADSAGTIIISGLTVDGGSVALNFMNNAYSFYMGRTNIWAPGAMLRASAPGETVPQFMSPALAVPTDVTVTAPVCMSAMCGTLNRAMAYTTTWTGGTAGTAEVNVSSGNFAAGMTASISCKVAANTGTLTIPAEILSDLTPGTGSVRVQPESSVTFSAGPYTTTFSARATGGGGTITIQ